jgi:small neutral amino acid transporter SnatA (MarC family)
MKTLLKVYGVLLAVFFAVMFGFNTSFFGFSVTSLVVAGGATLLIGCVLLLDLTPSQN